MMCGTKDKSNAFNSVFFPLTEWWQQCNSAYQNLDATFIKAPSERASTFFRALKRAAATVKAILEEGRSAYYGSNEVMGIYTRFVKSISHIESSDYMEYLMEGFMIKWY